MGVLASKPVISLTVPSASLTWTLNIMSWASSPAFPTSNGIFFCVVTPMLKLSLIVNVVPDANETPATAVPSNAFVLVSFLVVTTVFWAVIMIAGPPGTCLS